MGRGAQGDAVLDQRIGWLLQQIRIAYKHVTPDMWEKFRGDAAANDLLEAFANAEEGAPGGLYIAENVGRVILTATPP